MPVALRLAHALMTALFLFAAALQYNDVDIWRWVAIYLAAASVALAAAINRPQPRLAMVVGFIALGWAILYWLHGAGRFSLPALFSEWEMKDQTIVAGREMYGLAIIFAWMLVSWLTGRHRRRAGSATKPE